MTLSALEEKRSSFFPNLLRLASIHWFKLWEFFSCGSEQRTVLRLCGSVFPWEITQQHGMAWKVFTFRVKSIAWSKFIEQRFSSTHTCKGCSKKRFHWNVTSSPICLCCAVIVKCAFQVSYLLIYRFRHLCSCEKNRNEIAKKITESLESTTDVTTRRKNFTGNVWTHVCNKSNYLIFLWDLAVKENSPEYDTLNAQEAYKVNDLKGNPPALSNYR